MAGDPVGAVFVGLFIAFVPVSQLFAWGWPRPKRRRPHKTSRP